MRGPDPERSRRGLRRPRLRPGPGTRASCLPADPPCVPAGARGPRSPRPPHVHCRGDRAHRGPQAMGPGQWGDRPAEAAGSHGERQVQLHKEATEVLAVGPGWSGCTAATHARTRTHAHTHTRAHQHMHAHTNTCSRTLVRTHTHVHSCAHTRTLASWAALAAVGRAFPRLSAAWKGPSERLSFAFSLQLMVSTICPVPTRRLTSPLARCLLEPFLRARGRRLAVEPGSASVFRTRPRAGAATWTRLLPVRLAFTPSRVRFRARTLPIASKSSSLALRLT